MRKKAQLGNMQAVVMVIFFAAIILGVSLLVLQEFQQNSKTTESGASNSKTLLNGTAVALSHDELQSSPSCINATGGAAVGSGNYTVDLDAGTITLTTASPWNNTAVNCTYTYLMDNQATTVTNTTIGKLAGVPTWIGIIIIVFFAAIVIGLIRSGVMGGKTSGL